MAEPSITCTCLVQAGQISPAVEQDLRDALHRFTDTAFGAPPAVNWIAVPEGGGFTAGQPSQSSLVLVSAPSPVEQPRRETLLNEICEFWMTATGCSLDEIVAVVADPRG